jgi:hypothetical protein
LTSAPELARYSRARFGAGDRFARIGGGPVGGKAAGLLHLAARLESAYPGGRFGEFEVTVPGFAVVAADWFDAFLEENDLPGAAEIRPDDEIARAFQRGRLPAGLAGDLRALAEGAHAPLALRSSSLLEDALEHPFAGVYGTKMTPNDALDADTRFLRTVEALKFVWASTFFGAARAYRERIGAGRERMAVLVQEVVGRRHGRRWYPDVSGVARSLAFWRFGGAAPEDGIGQLALGLGRTIVQGEPAFTFCPTRPAAMPPYGSTDELLRLTQSRFWAVRMGDPPEFDPVRETEYLVHASLEDAARDGTLDLTASTLDPASERLVPGTGRAGPRVLTFAPLLAGGDLPLAPLVRDLLIHAEGAARGPAEIEFAVTLGDGSALPRLALLQCRPMSVATRRVDLTSRPAGFAPLLCSDHVLGNGVLEGITDVVSVVEERLEAPRSFAIAAELAALNGRMREEGRPYLLIGPGRWGSADPWLGIPVNWSDVSGAGMLVETAAGDRPIEMSQGSHFFHNLAAFAVPYACLPPGGSIDRAWLQARPAVSRTDLLRHVRLERPLRILVDGRSGRGVVLRSEEPA